VSRYHASGDCNPYDCRECDWLMANEREDHENRVCGGFSSCTVCIDEHDCDKTYEVLCKSCDHEGARLAAMN